MENFNLRELENAEITNIQQGDIVNGKVIKISRDTIYVDIGYKIEGKIDFSEFDKKPNINDKLEVLVLKQD